MNPMKCSSTFLMGILIAVTFLAGGCAHLPLTDLQPLSKSEALSVLQESRTDDTWKDSEVTQEQILVVKSEYDTSKPEDKEMATTRPMNNIGTQFTTPSVSKPPTGTWVSTPHAILFSTVTRMDVFLDIRGWDVHIWAEDGSSDRHDPFQHGYDYEFICRDKQDAAKVASAFAALCPRLQEFLRNQKQ